MVHAGLDTCAAFCRQPFRALPMMGFKTSRQRKGGIAPFVESAPRGLPHYFSYRLVFFDARGNNAGGISAVEDRGVVQHAGFQALARIEVPRFSASHCWHFAKERTRRARKQDHDRMDCAIIASPWICVWALSVVAGSVGVFLRLLPSLCSFGMLRRWVHEGSV